MVFAVTDGFSVFFFFILRQLIFCSTSKSLTPIEFRDLFFWHFSLLCPSSNFRYNFPMRKVDQPKDFESECGVFSLALASLHATLRDSFYLVFFIRRGTSHHLSSVSVMSFRHVLHNFYVHFNVLFTLTQFVSYISLNFVRVAMFGSRFSSNAIYVRK